MEITKARDADYLPSIDAWTADPTPVNASAMLKTIEPALRSAVSASASPDDPKIWTQARLRALELMPRWDRKASGLKTFLTSQLQDLKRYNVSVSNPVRAPERTAWTNARAVRAATELTDELGRPPTDTEIADRIGVPVKRMQRSRFLQGAVAHGQLRGPEGEIIMPEVVQKRNDQALSLVRMGLAPRYQYVMDNTLGGTSNREIAISLGISEARVSQMRAEVQRQIDAMRRQMGGGA